jgi:hypothetical protein
VADIYKVLANIKKILREEIHDEADWFWSSTTKPMSYRVKDLQKASPQQHKTPTRRRNAKSCVDDDEVAPAWQPRIV